LSFFLNIMSGLFGRTSLSLHLFVQLNFIIILQIHRHHHIIITH
jgi:hypothetical protein